MADLWSILTNLYSPVGALVADLRTKSPIDQLNFALAVVLPAGGFVLAAMQQARTAKGRLQRQVEDQNKHLDELHRERDRLSKSLDGATARLPETAQARAAAERRDRNEERAAMLARACIDENGPVLAGLAADVADHHLAMTSGGDDHLVAAERFATLALHLDPRQPAGEGLLTEVHHLRGDRALSRGDLAATVRAWDEAFAYTDQSEATPELILTLGRRLIELRDKGSYR